MSGIPLRTPLTYFDTADAYVSGTSERLIGQAFRRRRDQVSIATKAGYLFRERSALEPGCASSLARSCAGWVSE